MSPKDPHRNQIKQQLLLHPNIKKMIIKLKDSLSSISKLSFIPADFRVYGSFYWALRFLADMGLAAKDLMLEPLIKQLQLQQLEDGQFLIHYHPKKQQIISLTCVTAHLAYCLIRLGYKGSTTVNAALNYILTTQRHDGAWHCNRLKQIGELQESSPGCYAANIQVIRFLGQYGKKYEAIVKPTIEPFLADFSHISRQTCELDSPQPLNLAKLRYPPHYTGLDILNVIHSLSFFTDLIICSQFDRMVATILKRWDGIHWLRTEKRIPEWSAFDFSQKNGYSDWITSLFLQTIEQAYIIN